MLDTLSRSQDSVSVLDDSASLYNSINDGCWPVSSTQQPDTCVLMHLVLHRTHRRYVRCNILASRLNISLKILLCSVYAFKYILERVYATVP